MLCEFIKLEVKFLSKENRWNVFAFKSGKWIKMETFDVVVKICIINKFFIQETVPVGREVYVTPLVQKIEEKNWRFNDNKQ